MLNAGFERQRPTQKSIVQRNRSSLFFLCRGKGLLGIRMGRRLVPPGIELPRFIIGLN